VTRNRIVCLAIVALLLPTEVLAQSQGADGRVSDRASTDSQGTTTVYDANGSPAVAAPKPHKSK